MTRLETGQLGSVDIRVSVDPALKTGTDLAVTATIAADQTDVNPADNTAAVSSAVTRATDVAVTVTAGSSTVMPGGVAGYTVTVTNHGPLSASTVTLTDQLPTQVTDPQDPTSCTFRGNTATCTLGTMAVGASVSIPFRGTVPASTAVGTKLVDTALVTHETDTVPANNRDSATITVRATPPQPPPPTTPSTTQPIALTGENLLTQLVDALLLRSIASTLRAYSALSGLILRRVGPFLGAILADGAGPDPELREFLATIERERRIGNTGIVTHIRDRFGLPHGLTLDRAIDHVWTLTASEIADRLIRRCGSTVDAYESWLSDQLRAGFRSRD